MPHTPTDMSKWWTGSSCKLCQKLVISLFQSEISDVPAGCNSLSRNQFKKYFTS